MLPARSIRYVRPRISALATAACWAALILFSAMCQKYLAESRSRIAELEKLVPASVSPLPENTATLAVADPGADWKSAGARTFTLRFPPRFEQIAGTPPGVAEIPGFLYVEETGGCAVPSGAEAVTLPTGSVLRYATSEGSGFASGRSAGSPPRTGVICRVDGSASIEFKYYSEQEADALTSLASLAAVVSPWSAAR